jgi:hypothetical protein
VGVTLGSAPLGATDRPAADDGPAEELPVPQALTTKTTSVRSATREREYVDDTNTSDG